jgi:hypothetical protein
VWAIDFLKGLASQYLVPAAVGGLVVYLVRSWLERSDFRHRTRYPKLYEMRADLSRNLAFRVAKLDEAMSMMLDQRYAGEIRQKHRAETRRCAYELVSTLDENEIVLPTDVVFLIRNVIQHADEAIINFEKADRRDAPELEGFERADEAQKRFRAAQTLMRIELRKLLEK